MLGGLFDDEGWRLSEPELTVLADLPGVTPDVAVQNPIENSYATPQVNPYVVPGSTFSNPPIEHQSFGLVDAAGVPELTPDEFQALENSLASQPSVSATIDGHAPSMIAELEGWPSIPAYHAGDPAIQTNCGSADSGRGCIILHDMWEQ